MRWQLMSLQERLLTRVEIGGPDECWPWRGHHNAKGYGRLMLNNRSYVAHRVAYEMWVGPIPEGLVVMHACDNPPCCNPAHLSVGTIADNIRDMDAKGRRATGNAMKTHCPQGHPYDEKNTHRRADGARVCLACRAIRKRRARAKARMAAT